MSKNFIRTYSDICSCHFLDTNIFGYSFVSKSILMSHSPVDMPKTLQTKCKTCFGGAENVRRIMTFLGMAYLTIIMCSMLFSSITAKLLHCYAETMIYVLCFVIKPRRMFHLLKCMKKLCSQKHRVMNQGGPAPFVKANIEGSVKGSWPSAQPSSDVTNWLLTEILIRYQ